MNDYSLNTETLMCLVAIEADEEWLESIKGFDGDGVAKSLVERFSMTAKGRHELKDLILLSLAIGSVNRIDFDYVAGKLA